MAGQGGYFDGDTPDIHHDDGSVTVYAWTGTPHASTSTESITDPIIALEALVETAPAVGITLLGDGAVIVERSWDGGATWHRVRGGALVLAGGDYLVDHAAPLGVETTYRVVQGGVTLATAQITLESSTAWVQDPLDPSSALAVTLGALDQGRPLLAAGSLASAAYAQVSDLALVDGAAYPVASIGQRQVASDVPLVLAVDVAQDAGRLRRLLLSAGQLLVRGLPDSMLTPVAHVVATVKEARVGEGVGAVALWDLDATLVRPVSLTITIPRWTYEEVAAMYPEMTYAEVTASRPGADYLSWRRDPRP